jgi:aspartyl-tRNA(Asn)/glutamyl-tRNA(Gln) amidotransferase subunit C
MADSPKTNEQITPQVFEHLVKLAALQLDGEQAEYLRRELNHQLQSIHELEAIPMPDGLSITVHGVTYPHSTPLDLREDQWQPFPNSVDIIGQAPQSENDQFAVPDIPHTTLE